MDNQRLILLLVFSFSIIMLWESWQKQGHSDPAQASAVATQQARSAVDPSVPTPSLPSSTPASTSGAEAVPADRKEITPAAAHQIIRTDLFIAEISATGGDLVRLELLKHHATEDKNKNFVLFDNCEKHVYQAQSGLIGDGLPNHKTLYQFVSTEKELADGQQTLSVRLETTLNNIRVTKTYNFHRGNYLIDVKEEVTNTGTTPLALHTYFQTVRDGRPPEGAMGGMMGVNVFTGPALYTEQDKYHKVTFEDVAKGKAKFPLKADNGWIAMVQHYFVSAWLPQGKTEREFFIRKLGDDLYSAGLILPMNPIPPGATGSVDIGLYAGPQEQTNLAKIAPGLDLVVDYGWLTVVASPLFWILETIHKLVGNWGWAIIVLTVLLKAIFFPLSAASYKSMAKMKVVAPKLTRLKEMYGDDRARLNQEMMDLYKREKINPLGGCLPVLVQIPVFIALYWVLLGTVEMRYAPFIGYIHDLSAKDPYFVLPIIMGLTMVLQTRLNPAPPDPIQAKVMMFMPIMFTGMFLFFPSGLVLYWIVNNVLSIAQQWQINRVIEGDKKAA